MRSTITLDEDVASQIKRLMQERGSTFKATVNDLLRRGLRDDGTADEYATPTFELGLAPGVDLDKALSMVTAMEDADSLRKREIGK